MVLSGRKNRYRTFGGKHIWITTACAISLTITAPGSLSWLSWSYSVAAAITDQKASFGETENGQQIVGDRIKTKFLWLRLNFFEILHCHKDRFLSPFSPLAAPMYASRGESGVSPTKSALLGRFRRLWTQTALDFGFALGKNLKTCNFQRFIPWRNVKSL